MMAKSMELEFLLPIPEYFIYIALFAWAATFIGFISNITRKLFLKTQAEKE